MSDSESAPTILRTARVDDLIITSLLPENDFAMVASGSESSEYDAARTEAPVFFRPKAKHRYPVLTYAVSYPLQSPARRFAYRCGRLRCV
jgi:hypothetical protein